MEAAYSILDSILFNLVIYNVFLAIFNMIPLPPLDGSKILSTMLKGRNLQTYYQIEPYGPLLLILLLILAGWEVFWVLLDFLSLYL